MFNIQFSMPDCKKLKRKNDVLFVYADRLSFTISARTIKRAEEVFEE